MKKIILALAALTLVPACQTLPIDQSDLARVERGIAKAEAAVNLAENLAAADPELAAKLAPAIARAREFIAAAREALRVGDLILAEAKLREADALN